MENRAAIIHIFHRKPIHKNRITFPFYRSFRNPQRTDLSTANRDCVWNFVSVFSSFGTKRQYFGLHNKYCPCERSNHIVGFSTRKTVFWVHCLFPFTSSEFSQPGFGGFKEVRPDHDCRDSANELIPHPQLRQITK